jgi:fumarylacetoacetase
VTFAYGAQVRADGSATVAVRSGDQVVDLGRWAQDATGLDDAVRTALGGPDLGPLLAGGRAVWEATHAVVGDLLAAGTGPELVGGTPVLPFAVADFVDFYASRHHAENVGRIFRPSAPALPEAWLSLPIGYHGRAGSVVVSGTPVRRPRGQLRSPGGPVTAPTAKLDVEAEIGFVVGTPSVLGTPVPAADLADHVFGVCVVNDWSARDVQAFEYVPLGPFLGKSFATTVSAWVTPLPLLAGARLPVPADRGDLAAHLDGGPGWGLDLLLEIEVDGEVVSRPEYAAMHWSPAQMLAHLTSNGASLRTGDLYASGTVSGPLPGQYGSFLELTEDGARPLPTAAGPRGYLRDGDHVVIRASARTGDGAVVPLHEAAGTVLAALDPGTSVPAPLPTNSRSC